MNFSIPRVVYDYFVKRWFLSSFILTSATIWFSILQVFGSTWHLVDETGTLVPSANYVTWAVVSITIIFAVLRTIADKYNEDAKNNGQYVLGKLLQSMDYVTTKKMNRFCDYIQALKNKDGGDPFLQITQPREQITSIIENIQLTLSDLFGLPRSDIGISIIYKNESESSWSWLVQLDNTGDLSLEQIVNQPSSSARQIIDGKTSVLFYADKRIGRDKHEYFPAAKDDPYHCVGSIVCREINIGNDEKYVRAVLSISTFGKQFCEEGDSYSRDKIINFLLPPFIKRIQLELSLLHIKYLVEKR